MGPMEEQSKSPASVRPKGDAEGAAQLSLLLHAATAVVDEEFKRSERYDAKSRNLITVTGAFFAVVQAVVVALINGSLAATKAHDASTFVPWIVTAGIASTLGLAVAVYYSYRAWQLRDEDAVAIKTIRAYRDAALAGNPAVGAKLVDGYTTVAERRREVNEDRATAVDAAAIGCGIAMALIGTELIVALVAAAV
jgi:cellobiose-specific phosphotransferase system component IIC